MKRVFDLVLASIMLFLLSAPMLLIVLAIKLSSEGNVLYWSDRVGLNNVIFKMPKFRTMHMDAPAVATHLFKDANQYLTLVGSFLRKFSLDELPQLFNIVSGDMTFVGPRPALFNQDDLVELRTKKNIHTLTPGITGWAQINGRDELPIPVKVELDEYYLRKKSLFLDTLIIIITVLKVINREGVSH